MNNHIQAGFEVAKEIRKTDSESLIVFISTHTELVLTSYKYMVSALQFIQKNVDFLDFQKEVETCVDAYIQQKENIKTKSEYIIINLKASSIKMDINDIYGIIDKFDASGCSELNLEMNGVCLGLKKTMHEAICDVPVKKDIVRINTEQEQTVTTIQDVQPQSDEHIKEIKAPLVGTFYTAAGPDEEPFVKPGQSVHAGDVIGIIEAMKLMNEVTADCDGTVKEVAAENGTMVEYGQPLVILN